MASEKAQAASNCEAESSDASDRGGPPRSSDEAGVMLVERRGRATAVGAGQLEPSGNGRSPISRRKAVAFLRWHEPNKPRGLRSVL